MKLGTEMARALNKLTDTECKAATKPGAWRRRRALSLREAIGREVLGLFWTREESGVRWAWEPIRR